MHQNCNMRLLTNNSFRRSEAFVNIRQWNNYHWFRYWLVTWSAPSHYLNQWWNIVDWALRNKIQKMVFAIFTFSFKKIQLKILPAQWLPLCIGLSVIIFGKNYESNWLSVSLSQLIVVSYRRPGTTSKEIFAHRLLLKVLHQYILVSLSIFTYLMNVEL